MELYASVWAWEKVKTSHEDREEWQKAKNIARTNIGIMALRKTIERSGGLSAPRKGLGTANKETCLLLFDSCCIQGNKEAGYSLCKSTRLKKYGAPSLMSSHEWNGPLVPGCWLTAGVKSSTWYFAMLPDALRLKYACVTEKCVIILIFRTFWHGKMLRCRHPKLSYPY